MAKSPAKPAARKPQAAPKSPRPAVSSKPQAPVGPQPKILRVGVIQAGKIVEEKLIRRRESVTVGASPRNTIVVPASTLPRTFTLFDLAGGQYHLVFNDAMDGRVSVQNQVLSLDQVKQGGHARPGKGNLLRLALNEGSRGKVLLGEVTLLFQFVAPPPIQPRPQLPPSVRGSFVTQVDWTLASSYAAVSVMMFAFLLYARSIDIPRKLAVDVIPDDFAEYVPTVEKPKIIDITKLAKETGEKQIEKTGPVKAAGDGSRSKKAGVPKPCDEACQAAKAAERRARLAKAVAGLGALKLLGTKGKGDGTASDLLGKGDPGRKLDSAFNGVSGLRAGKGGSSGALRGKGGGGSGKAAGIGDLGARVGGPGQVGTGGMVAEKVPKAANPFRGGEDVSGTLDKNQLGRSLRLAANGVKVCYERALKRNPSLSGKISVRIEINAMGRVTGVSIESDSINDPMVSSCVKDTMNRQRFPAPEGGPAEVVVPFVFQASQ